MDQNYVTVILRIGVRDENYSARTTALQPINFMTNNASCNWVNLVQVSSVQLRDRSMTKKLLQVKSFGQISRGKYPYFEDTQISWREGGLLLRRTEGRREETERESPAKVKVSSNAGTIFSLCEQTRRVGGWTRSGKLTLTLTSY